MFSYSPDALAGVWHLSLVAYDLPSYAKDHGTRKQKKSGFAFLVLKPTRVSGFFFCCSKTAEKAKKMVSRTASTSLSPRLTEHGSRQNVEGVCSTGLRTLAAEFRGPQVVCVWRSHLWRERPIHLCTGPVETNFLQKKNGTSFPIGES